MVNGFRTDLALEARGLAGEQGQKAAGEHSGVTYKEEQRSGLTVTTVEVTSEEGEKALGKPRGTYCTLSLGDYYRRPGEVFPAAVEELCRLLRGMLPEEGSVFVAGLGNRAMTPDAVGSLAVESLLITRHLKDTVPGLRPVSAAAVGVLGTTGLESAEWVRGLREDAAAVIVIDALAARSVHRLCTTIQVSDTGIIPGSGVGNRRMALNRESLGVPVIAVGVPTVVDGATLAADLTGEKPGETGRDLFVTPRDVDAKVKEVSRLVAYGINRALQPGLTTEDITALLT